MKKLVILILSGLLFSFPGKAQLKNRMLEFQKYPCVTITQLNKNLYGLYKRKNIPPEAEELLKNLSEVNILNLDLSLCDSATEKAVYDRFRPFLDKNSENYQLVKSSTRVDDEQRIYARHQNDKISDLVVFNHTPSRLDIIELRGNIQTENIALLSKALNIKGITSLSALSPENDSYQKFIQDFNYNTVDMTALSERLREIRERLREKWGNMHSDFKPQMDFDLENMHFLFDSLGTKFGKMEDIMEQMGKRFDDVQIQANSVEITEENGKTKIKINTKNSDMAYIVDGILFEGEEVTMPAQIQSARTVQDPNDPKKSYLIVLSRNPLGNFLSLKNNILKFNYNDKDYQFDLKKSEEPLIWMDGILIYNFKIKPSNSILQIRPVSEAEKKTGAFKSAEVIVITRT